MYLSVTNKWLCSWYRDGGHVEQHLQERFDVAVEGWFANTTFPCDNCKYVDFKRKYNDLRGKVTVYGEVTQASKVGMSGIFMLNLYLAESLVLASCCL